MSVKQSMREMLPEVEQALKVVINRNLADPFAELRGMLAYHMGWEGQGAGPEAQGKRIRPMLVLLGAQSAGGDWHRAIPAAAAVELLHNFSLIHDDIQDQSLLRRNRPTVWSKWGVAQAINAGDVMYTLAFMAMHGLKETVSVDAALDGEHVLLETCLHLTQGQYLDLSYESKPLLPETAYWPMVAGKTAALLGACIELGALTAGASLAQREAYREFGNALGLAFQVQDDWLGIWGDAAMTGKSTDSDLVSGKKSLPVLYSLNKGGMFARRWNQGPVHAEDVPELVLFLEQDGAGEYTLQQAERLTAQALDALKRAAADSDQTADLRELAAVLLERKN